MDIGKTIPRGSKKIARAINATSGGRPVVVLANLAGFDRSPESMREWQLEFGAEIGCAVVNFDGPVIFCLVSRYHGRAFVVFSQRLDDQLETVALEGARASVIGGAPPRRWSLPGRSNRRRAVIPGSPGCANGSSSALGSGGSGFELKPRSY